jgi:hypothetical protein
MPRLLIATLRRRFWVYSCGLAAGLAVWSSGEAGELKAATPVRIEPDYGVVPANHLKFYLHFGGPMERGNVFQYLRLIETDEKGKEIAEVPEPFREVELWDETFTRLTLWFHPGRQKPGVNLNVEIGPILEEGKSYALEISGKWPTESGNLLSENLINHKFLALPMDERQPNPAEWETSGGRMIICNDLLDPASLAKFIKVETSQGEPIGIKIEALERAHKVPSLLPRSEGRKLPRPLADDLSRTRLALPATLPHGHYRLIIDPKLEDLAGNSIARPFNVDLNKQPNFKERTEPVIVTFEVPAREKAKP